jgi:hypothetical protein
MDSEKEVSTMSWTIVCDLPMNLYHGNQILDTTDFQNNADILGSIVTHKGYVTFKGGDAQLEVPVHNDSLSKFSAIRVQALIRPSKIMNRYNIVEGWMSFAFIIGSNGRLAGTIYDGQDWIGPDSGTSDIRPNVWSRVSFEYDGISIAKLSINGSRVGIKQDMPSGMRQPQQVITLGHWPRGDGRYTLQGDLGHVRIERRSPEDYWRDAIHIALCQRSLSPLQADAMREIHYLAGTIDPAEREQLIACAKEQSDQLNKFIHQLREWSRGAPSRLHKLARTLRKSWCCFYNAPAIHEVLVEYFKELNSQNNSRLSSALADFYKISSMCVRKGYPYDRIRELCLVVWPELRTFEMDLNDIAQQVLGRRL